MTKTNNVANATKKENKENVLVINNIKVVDMFRTKYDNNIVIQVDKLFQVMTKIILRLVIVIDLLLPHYDLSRNVIYMIITYRWFMPFVTNL